MKTEQIMAMHGGYVQMLCDAIEALVQERDALRAEAGDLTVQQRNSYQKGHNAGVAHHKEATQKLVQERDALRLVERGMQLTIDGLNDENKTLRDALEPFCDGDIPDDDAPTNYIANAKKALQGANHEPN